jgi:hypothetical protein
VLYLGALQFVSDQLRIRGIIFDQENLERRWFRHPAPPFKDGKGQMSSE